MGEFCKISHFINPRELENEVTVCKVPVFSRHLGLVLEAIKMIMTVPSFKEPIVLAEETTCEVPNASGIV